MFGLWYISLAIDELRKHFGWTFFGLFNENCIKKQETILPGNNGNELTDKHNGGKVLEVATNKNEEKKVDPIVPKSDLVESKKPAPIVPHKVEKPEPKQPVSAPEPEKPKIKPIAAVVNVPTKPEPQPQGPNKTDVPITNGSSINAPVSLPSPKKPMQDVENNLLKMNNNKLPMNIKENEKLTSNTNMVDTSINGSLNKPNMKNATNSFLAEESSGGLGKPKPKTDVATKRNKSDTMVDAAVLEKLEAGFAKLSASNSKSLLKKYLTKAVFDNLKNKVTPTFKSTLLDVIQSGLENHDSGVGIYAPDAESYTTFAELFDPIIEDYHGGFKKTDKHPQRNFGDVSVFSNLDPNSEFVVSTRVRCGRSMEGYPFNPCLTEAQYKEMESKVSSTLSGMDGELKGKFYPLTGMEKTVQQQLIDDHFLFKEGDRFLQAANACRYWPSGRGIYHNDAKTFLVWCNEEDHLRIISMQMGGDLGQVYSRLVTAVNDIEKRIPFSHNDRLGFLTFCPTNLGTTIRASVHIKVPKLAANLSKLEEIAGKYNLQVRGTRGEHTEAEGGIYDISNKRRMGLTEFDAVKEMYDGIAELIKIEKSL